MKLLLVDGYQNPLQPRENPSSNNHQASSLTNGVIVAMEISPIPNLTDHTVAGTKLLLTFGDEEGVSTTNCSSTGTPRVSHGVLLLTPQNCLVVGGLVPELASEQARQRKAFQDQSGASITDPTIRALVSHNYMADANADDDEGTLYLAMTSTVCTYSTTSLAVRPSLFLNAQRMSEKGRVETLPTTPVDLVLEHQCRRLWLHLTP